MKTETINFPEENKDAYGRLYKKVLERKKTDWSKHTKKGVFTKTANGSTFRLPTPPHL